MNRFRYSSQRLALPDFCPKELMKCIQELIYLEKGWISDKKGYALYIRPTHIATTVNSIKKALIGVKPTHESKIFVILTPTGSYYETGFSPISLFVENHSIRAAPYGTGCYKIGGFNQNNIEIMLQPSTK